MSAQLGTLDELPQSYRDSMAKASVVPLWPLLRNAMPHDTPQRVTKSHCWRFQDVRPLLLQAGKLTPVEKAERRVLVLSDPGRGGTTLQATAVINVGFQLLLPGEVAPSHRHTPNAARIVVEGEGANTIVDGEKLEMEEGDVILTPGGAWHEHEHNGRSPVIWLDVLDIPLFMYLEAAYAVDGERQSVRNRPDSSQLEYATAGLVPTRSSKNPAAESNAPLLRYAWKQTEAALRRIAEYTDVSQPIELDYVNPETGASCLRVLGLTAMMLRPGETVRPPVRSASSVFHVISGSGRTLVDGESKSWSSKDTLSVPVFANLTHQADEVSFLIRIHDTPLQRHLGFYEERKS